MGYISNAGAFLIQTVFGIYEVLILLRLLMQFVRADFYNPISQFIVKATNPPLKPLRRVIPGYAGIDFASIFVLFILILLETVLISTVTTLPVPSITGLIILSIVGALQLLVYVFLFSIFVLAILSWVNPGTYNPVAQLLGQITNPLIRPVRKYIPPFSGLDLSPMVAIIALYLVLLLIIAPLQDWARSIAYGVSPAVLGF
jgi:YggT family protein